MECITRGPRVSTLRARDLPGNKRVVASIYGVENHGYVTFVGTRAKRLSTLSVDPLNVRRYFNAPNGSPITNLLIADNRIRTRNRDFVSHFVWIPNKDIRFSFHKLDVKSEQDRFSTFSACHEDQTMKSKLNECQPSRCRCGKRVWSSLAVLNRIKYNPSHTIKLWLVFRRHVFHVATPRSAPRVVECCSHNIR